MILHKMLGMIILNNFDFQGCGLKVKATVAISRENFVIALVPTFIDGFSCYFTQMLGIIISPARSNFRVLGSRSRSLWLFLEKLCYGSSAFY